MVVVAAVDVGDDPCGRQHHIGAVLRTLRCGEGLLNMLSDHVELWAYPRPVWRLYGAPIFK